MFSRAKNAPNDFPLCWEFCMFVVGIIGMFFVIPEMKKRALASRLLKDFALVYLGLSCSSFQMDDKVARHVLPKRNCHAIFLLYIYIVYILQQFNSFLFSSFFSYSSKKYSTKHIYSTVYNIHSQKCAQ